MNKNLKYTNKIIKYLFWLLPSIIKNVVVFQGTIDILVYEKNILPLLLFLKKHTLFKCDSLIDIIIYDNLFKSSRFVIIYSLLSFNYNIRLNICSYIKEFQNITSVTCLYSSACWIECEILDMFGIFFKSNYNLKRILTSYGFDGYPLRKDFPQWGYVEIKYNYTNKNLIYRPVQLAQNFRVYKLRKKKLYKD